MQQPRTCSSILGFTHFVAFLNPAAFSALRVDFLALNQILVYYYSIIIYTVYIIQYSIWPLNTLTEAHKFYMYSIFSAVVPAHLWRPCARSSVLARTALSAWPSPERTTDASARGDSEETPATIVCLIKILLYAHVWSDARLATGYKNFVN